MKDTRTKSYFENKIRKIEEAIEKCFDSLNEIQPNIHHYKMEDIEKKVETTYANPYSICNSIEKLESLRAFYVQKLE